MDAGGFWTGLEINGTPTAGGVKVNTDKFSLGRPGEDAVYPFEVVGGQTRIKSAVIGDLTVDRAKIKYGVSGEASMYVDSEEIDFNNTSYAGNPFFPVAEITLTPLDGAPIRGSFTCMLSNVSGGNTNVGCRVVRDDGTVIWGRAAGTSLSATTNGETVNLVFLDAVDAGRPTNYAVQFRKGANSPGDVVRVKGRVLFVEELSRHHFQNINMNADSGEGPGRGLAGGGSINGTLAQLANFY